MNDKVLVIAPKRLGDALMCTPALQLLAKEMSDTLIDIIAESKLSADTLSGNPLLNEIFVCPSEETLKCIAKNYTHVVNIHHAVSSKNPVLSILRVANPGLVVIEPEADCELDGCHQANYAMKRMVAWLECESPETDEFCYQVFPTDQDDLVAKELLNSDGRGKKRLVGFHLGCHSVAKRARFWKNQSHSRTWDVKYFIQLDKKIHEMYPNAQIVITGSENEKYLANKFCRKCPHTINLTGKTSVKELAAVMGKLDAYITPDTGTMHLAFAVDTPTITLFGPTVPSEKGPYPVINPSIHCVLKKDNVDDITVDSVFENVVRLIDDK